MKTTKEMATSYAESSNGIYEGSTSVQEIYPRESSIPAGYLVEPDLQPTLTAPDPALDPTITNIADTLTDRHVREGLGESVALIEAETGRRLSYQEVATASASRARQLVGIGVRPGDRIAFRAPNVPEAVVAILAVWKAGGVVVPTPVQAQAAELRFLLEDTEAKFLLVHERENRDLTAAVEPRQS